MNRHACSTRSSERLLTATYVKMLLVLALLLGALCGRADAQSTGSISGTVTNAGTGAPLAGVIVYVYTSTGSYAGGGSTSASGVYTVGGLATGTYYVRTSNSLGYLDELYNNLPCPGGGCPPLTTGTGLNVTAGATTSGIDFGLALLGTITGTVTNAGTGAPLAGVGADIYNASGSYVGYGYTNASGVYTVIGLATGTYYVRTWNSLGYVDELYDNLPCPGGACTVTTGTVVSVTVGATTSGINFGLALGGTITGTVTNAGTGTPLAGVEVEAYNGVGSYVDYGYTNASGVYTVGGLATGTYYLRTSNSLGYVDELYDNLPCSGGICPAVTTGTGVSVTAGATTSGINFGLAVPGTITGTVTNAGTGAPLAGVYVYAYTSSGSSVGSGYTNTSGVYTKTGLAAGTYYVRTSNSLGYLDELYNNLPCPGGACTVTAGTGVSVTAGATTSGIDFGLAVLGRITGTVTNAGTGVPLSNVSVSVYAASGSSVGGFTTNASGIYTTTGLATGTYYLRTSNSLGYLDELYDNLPCWNGCYPYTIGTGVSVTVGATTSGIDFGLAMPGTITGTVTNAGTGAPIAGVSVYVYASSGSSLGSSSSNASGVYTRTGLPSGTYYVRTSNTLGYLDELYNNLPCPGGACTVTTGTAVSVTSGATTSGIDFGLVLGGTITGAVTNAGTGAPLASVSVSVYTAGGSLAGSLTTNASGVYTKAGLSTATYYVRTSNGLGYLDELYNNLPCPGGACPPLTTGTGVSVTAGATTSGIDFGLAPAGTITGTVTDAGTGAPLASVTVSVYTAGGNLAGSLTTNASGVYTKTALATGNYYLRTSNSLGYLDELYNNLPCPGGACPPLTTGTGVSVTAGATTSGIDFGLALGGTITGTVTDAGTGALLANVSVSVYTASGSSVGSFTTNASGVYTTTGLATGSYYVRTSNGVGYLDELYNNLPCPGGACPPLITGTGVSVTVGATTSGINFGLPWGGTITGTVTDAETGAPLAGVSVYAYTSSGASLGSASSNTSGVYTARGLPSGTYYMRTSNSLGYLDELFNNLPCPGGACTVTTGTGVSVTAGATTTGIDFGLTLGGTITGTVTNAETGAPLEESPVAVYNASGSIVASRLTNFMGVYTARGLPSGTYYVRTSNGYGYNGYGYLDELYNNLPCPGGECPPLTTGTGVSVTAGATTSGIDFGLALAWRGTITGTVTDAGTGAPLAGVAVGVYTASGSSVGSFTMNASGVYTMTGLATGTYYVRTSNSLGYVDELYNNLPCPGGTCPPLTTGTGVSVTTGVTTSGINFGLALGGTITGTVTDAGTGAPLADVAVAVYTASGSSVGSFTTNASGVYTKTGLPSGTYYVRTSNSVGYLDELYNNLPCAGGACTVTTGTGVSVTAGVTTSGINFGLAVGGTITGTVTDAGTGVPLADVSVAAYTASGSPVGSYTTNASGVYTKTGLATGTYYVRTSNSVGYLDELYNNLPCAGGACTVTTGTGVSVTVGATTSGINFGLPWGGTITGTVTDAGTGAPLAGVSVYAYNSSGSYVGYYYTNASGVYWVEGLATGTYYVRTSYSVGYLDELYDNLPCPGGACPPLTTGTGVSVTAGTTTSGINFGLAAGGTITGRVTDAGTGALLANVSVAVYTASGSSVGSFTTNASGVYIKTGLATGTYYVRTSNSVGYLDELYDNLPCPGGSCPPLTTGTGVSVTVGATTSGIDFGLPWGGTITGTVTDAGTGAPLAGVSVFAYTSSGSSLGSASTNASGVYTKTGLATGTYYVRTSNSVGYLDELYNNLPCLGGTCTVTTGTGVSVTAGATTSGINFGLAVGGTITGTVTDAATGALLANVSVAVYTASGSSVGSFTTNASGVYINTGLATGTYYVRTSNSVGYLDELYDNLPCPGGACSPYTNGTGVSVTAGVTTSGINFGLARGGTITGAVTNAGTGAPLASISVWIYYVSGSSYTSVTTDASGVYTRTGMGTGTYYLRTSNSRGYLDELYNNLPCLGGTCTVTTGTGVSVTAGATTSGINFALAVGGTITGTVTDAGTGTPLAGVEVEAYNGVGSYVGSSYTDASGVYTRTVVATGTYYLRTSNSLGYIDELYNNLPCAGGACSPYTNGTGVSVTAGVTTSGINFGLAVGGTITGTVTDAGTGTPLANVSVAVYTASGSSVGSFTTNASGVYWVVGLATGTCYVRTSNSVGYLDELYDNLPCSGGSCTVTMGTGVSVTAGATTSGINFGLAVGGTITGTVTDAGTGTPLAGVYVYAYNSSGSYVGYYYTNASGVYTKTGLATGTYYLRTSNSVGYLDELYDNLPCWNGCYPYTSGTGVSVTVGATTSGINFGLAVGGTITGTVTNAGTGTPLAGVSVYAYNSSGSSAGTSGTTNASGVYTVIGLGTGTYYVRTSNSLGYIDELYNNLPCPPLQGCTVTTGTGVSVTAGVTTSGINFGLALGGTITGTVTNAGTGAPLAGVSVRIYNASGGSYTSVSTNASGVYTVIGLGTGTYYVRTSNSLGYLDELYNNLPCPGGCTVTSGTAVSVTAGATTSGIDFGLAVGGTITGTVTNAGTGAPLAGVDVYAYTSSGSSAGSGYTNASGVYTVIGLATGTNYVRTSNSLGYVDELYDNLPCPGGFCTVTSGTAVSVTAGATTSGINFGLAVGGTITGTVTNAGTGAPLAYVTVYAYTSSGSYAGSVSTNASGVYTNTGLPTGTHYVRTSNSVGYLDELYDNLPCPGGACTVTTGTAVSVTAGATTSGIDFGLALGGTITGTVTDAGTGAPLANVSVRVYNSTGSTYTSATTSASGVYTKTGLATGTYYVRTSNSLGYVDELYNNLPCPGGACTVTTGTGVAVTAGATTSGIDFGLAALGTVTGTVTVAGTGAPLAGVSVFAYTSSGSSLGSAATNASGVYIKTGLPTGTYYVRTSNSLGYLDELYDNLPCPGGACTVTTGTGVSVTAGATASGIDFGLARVGAGDFTGDRKSDILWRHASRGELWLWPMDGAARTAETYVRTVADTDWEIRGVGDQTGDGKTDILWRNKVSGMIYFWPMDGTTVLSETYVATVDPAYDIVGTGDYDGNGKTDILWRHMTTGAVWVWLMNGATPLSQVYVDTVDPGYVVKGSGDLNGDTKADIVWHHGTRGDVWGWLMNGTTRTSQTYIGTVGDAGYEIVGVADHTGDGKADILWHHATRGEVWMWPMDGTTVLSESYVDTVPDTGYQIVGNGDYNGDTKADILWHHATRGEVWVWLMNGTSRISQTWVATVPEVSYQIVR